jgi:hypothetical protein
MFIHRNVLVQDSEAWERTAAFVFHRKAIATVTSRVGMVGTTDYHRLRVAKSPHSEPVSS